MLKLGRKRAAFLLCCLLLPITPLKAETTVVEIVDYRDGQEAVLQTFSTPRIIMQSTVMTKASSTWACGRTAS